MRHILFALCAIISINLYADDYKILQLNDGHVLLPYVELSEGEYKRLNNEDKEPVMLDTNLQPTTLRPSMSPVRNQKYRPSCSVFAAIAMFEYYYPRTDFSEQCLAKFSSNYDPGHTHQRLIYSINNGLYLERDCPYQVSPSGRNTIPNLTGKPKTWPAGGFAYLNTDDSAHIEHIQSRLMAGHPVGVSIFVAGRGWQTGDIMHAPTQAEINADCITMMSGIKRCAAHAVVVTGYSRQAGIDYLEFKNSWGESWGSRGYGKMSLDYFNKMRMAYVISK